MRETSVPSVPSVEKMVIAPEFRPLYNTSTAIITASIIIIGVVLTIIILIKLSGKKNKVTTVISGILYAVMLAGISALTYAIYTKIEIDDNCMITESGKQIIGVVMGPSTFSKMLLPIYIMLPISLVSVIISIVKVIKTIKDKKEIKDEKKISGGTKIAILISFIPLIYYIILRSVALIANAMIYGINKELGSWL